MGKIELGGEDEAEETMEIRGDTVKHKGKSNQTFQSKTSSSFHVTIVLLRRKRRALKRRDALWRLFAHEKVCESRYFLLRTWSP